MPRPLRLPGVVPARRTTPQPETRRTWDTFQFTVAASSTMGPVLRPRPLVRTVSKRFQAVSSAAMPVLARGALCPSPLVKERGRYGMPKDMDDDDLLLELARARARIEAMHMTFHLDGLPDDVLLRILGASSLSALFSMAAASSRLASLVQGTWSSSEWRLRQPASSLWRSDAYYSTDLRLMECDGDLSPPVASNHSILVGLGFSGLSAYGFGDRVLISSSSTDSSVQHSSTRILSRVTCLAASPRHAMVATGSEEGEVAVHVRAFATHEDGQIEPHSDWAHLRSSQHEGTVHALCWLADEASPTFYSGAADSGLREWDVDDGVEGGPHGRLRCLACPHLPAGAVVALAACGSMVVTGSSDGTISVWEHKPLHARERLQWHLSVSRGYQDIRRERVELSRVQVHSLALSSHTLAASGHAVGGGGFCVWLWHVPREWRTVVEWPAAPVYVLPPAAWPEGGLSGRCAAIAMQADLLVAATAHSVYLWHLDGEWPARHEATRARVSRDPTLVDTGDSKYSAAVPAVLPVAARLSHPSAANISLESAARACVDGPAAVAASAAAPSSAYHHEQTWPGPLAGLALSSDGGTLLASYDSGVVRVWRTAALGHAID